MMSNQALPVSAAILIGGKSSRYGSDKTNLMIDDTPISVDLHDRLSRLVDEVFFISDRIGKEPLRGATVFIDRQPDKGPLGGLHTALIKCRHESCFLLPCDMPFFRTEILDLLWQTRDEAMAVVPRWAGKVEPLSALYHKNCLDALHVALETDRVKLIRFLDEIKARYIDLDQHFSPEELKMCFFNINTPQQYEQARLISQQRDSDSD